MAPLGIQYLKMEPGSAAERVETIQLTEEPPPEVVVQEPLLPPAPSNRTEGRTCCGGECDWLRVERSAYTDVFLSSSGTPAERISPSDLPGATKFLSVFTTLEVGFLVLTYFFLTCYWVVPFLLPGMFIAQLFLQFILFLYSDYFCRVAYRITWRFPFTASTHQYFCSICDWLLIFCFFLSWSAALIVAAPVFAPWRNFLVFPEKYDVQIAQLRAGMFGPSSADPASALYFHRDVGIQSRAVAMLIPSAVPTSSDIDFPAARATNGFSAGAAEKLAAIWDTDYGHRVWPNLWLGNQVNSTVGAVLLEDAGWRSRLSGGVGRESASSVSTVPAINVWSVCSDAATLDCGCYGTKLTHIVRPPRCANGNLCGVEMLPGMGVQTSVRRLVHEAKKTLDIPMATKDRFICLTDPALMRQHVQADMQLGGILGLPFLTALGVIFIRLLFFYLCQVKPDVQADEALLPLSTLT